MKKENIAYKAKSNGYWFYQYVSGIVEAFSDPLTFTEADKLNPCVYQTTCKCNSQKEFEQEVIYLVNKIQEV